MSRTTSPDEAQGERLTTGEILTSIGECVYDWDLKSGHIVWNEGAAGLLNIDDPAQIATARRFDELLLPQTKRGRTDTVLSSHEEDRGSGVPYCLQYGLCAKRLGTQSDIWLEDSGRWFVGENGKPARARGVLRIVNERRQKEERLQRLARFDPLTGLFNRAHLNLCLEEAFKESRHTGTNGSFLLVGLEHFELINSVYGYDCGDAVIREIAKRLQENLRDVDIVGRFSGAKIGVILPECDERSLRIAAHRILNILRSNVISTEAGAIAISISIGGVVFPKYAREPRVAHLAAYQALTDSRRARDASVVSFRPDPQREEAHKAAAQLAEEIVSALKNGRVHLAWQPVVKADGHAVAFHEALIRLERPDGTTMQAGDFVATAQELGLIRMIDHHALDLALEALIANPKAHMSLNVCNDTATDPEWLSKLAAACHSNRSLPERLIIEITESHAAESMEDARAFIDDIHALGCKVALDDFGAGFTSFRNLKSLPFDIIKIDGQFVDHLHDSHENQSFIRALVDLARLFNASTVVEWVEDDGTAALLHEWGVDYLQGYRYGEPVRDPDWHAVFPSKQEGEDNRSLAASA